MVDTGHRKRQHRDPLEPMFTNTAFIIIIALYNTAHDGQEVYISAFSRSLTMHGHTVLAFLRWPYMS